MPAIHVSIPYEIDGEGFEAVFVHDPSSPEPRPTVLVVHGRRVAVMPKSSSPNGWFRWATAAWPSTSSAPGCPGVAWSAAARR
jgi:hypothetical protein